MIRLSMIFCLFNNLLKFIDKRILLFDKPDQVGTNVECQVNELIEAARSEQNLSAMFSVCNVFRI
jgi:hypothetical protein